MISNLKGLLFWVVLTLVGAAIYTVSSRGMLPLPDNTPALIVIIIAELIGIYLIAWLWCTRRIGRSIPSEPGSD